MKTIIRTIRKKMLKWALEKCIFKQIKLGVITDRYHENIIKSIRKGEDKLKIEKLKFRRDKLNREKMELIDLEFKFRSKLRRA